MIKPWVLEKFLREMTDGFYVDLYPESDWGSSTRLLSVAYRWRGIAITSKPVEFHRSNMFKPYVIDLNANPKGLFTSLYDVHPGSMIHYVCSNNVPNISEVLNQLYIEDTEKPFSTNKTYPHFNIISLELIGSVSKSLTEQLTQQFDLSFSHKDGDSNWFVNEILSYLK